MVIPVVVGASTAASVRIVVSERLGERGEVGRAAPDETEHVRVEQSDPAEITAVRVPPFRFSWARANAVA
jgi:hypothetical protein